MKLLTHLRFRLAKFLDNPRALWPFLQKHLYYNFVCDRYLDRYDQFTFLPPQETIDHIIREHKSFIRFGDEAIAMIKGCGLYYSDWHQKWDAKLARRYEEIISSSNEQLLVGFNPWHFLKTKRQLRANGINATAWTYTKVFLYRYLNPGQTYGTAYSFRPKYNPDLDLQQLQRYFATKHIIIVTGRIERFTHIELGKTTDFVPCPKDDVWQQYDDVYARATALVEAKGYPKDETLFLISLACTAKVMTFDLTQAGYQAWDTGQLFEAVYQAKTTG